MAGLSGISKRHAQGADNVRLVSVREAAAALGVHEHTIRAWVRKGIIHAMHLPGSNYARFRPEEVRRVQLLMEQSGGVAGVRIDPPPTDPVALAQAHKMHEEVMAILADQPPEETLEEVMSRLRGRPWSS